MSGVGLVMDPVFEDHDTGPGHPERPERLVALRAAFSDGGLHEGCRRIAPETATDEQLTRVHDADYVASVERACATRTIVPPEADTVVCPASPQVARAAAGSAAALAREVAGGTLRRGFAALRPPGHHAERDRAMGFCLFNNVAVAAAELLTLAHIERVLIVDFDVHHGNGTQHIFEEAADVFYFSVHQSPLYPGTGAASERGRGAGEGTTLNRPLPPGAGDREFLGALHDDLGPAIDAFRPDFVLVSAGFDAHERDPLADLRVTTEAYAEATELLVGYANDHAGGRIVSLLEGGYDLEALSASARLHVEVLLAG